MSKFEENVMKLLGEINSRLDKMDEKFAGIDSQFDKVNEKFAGIDSRFDKVDEKFAGIDSRFDKVDEKFVEMNDRFEKLETDIEEIKAENQFIKRAVLETNDGVKTISEDQKSIHEILGEHDVSIRTLRRKSALIEEYEL